MWLNYADIKKSVEFPGSPMVRNLHFHGQGPMFDPLLGN